LYEGEPAVAEQRAIGALQPERRRSAVIVGEQARYAHRQREQRHGIDASELQNDAGYPEKSGDPDAEHECGQ